MAQRYTLKDITPDAAEKVEAITAKLMDGVPYRQAERWAAKHFGVSVRTAATWTRTAWTQWYNDPAVQAGREENRQRRIAEAEAAVDKLMAQKAYTIQGDEYDCPQGSAAAKWFELVLRMEGLLTPDVHVGTINIQQNLIGMLRQHYGFAEDDDSGELEGYTLPMADAEE